MPKPPRPEKRYFDKIDSHKKQKIAEAKRKELAIEEIERIKELHWRRCGNCGMELEEVVFKGVNILKCFQCGSVLLLRDAFVTLCGKENRFIEGLLDLFKF